MKPVANLRELRKAFASVTSGCAGDTIFMAKASMYLIELLESEHRRKQRKPTKYQKFFARGIRKGLTAAQVAQEWKGKH